MFFVQLHGKWANWGRYNLYFEACLLLKKRTLIFFFWFCRNCHATIPEHIQVDPIGGLNLKV